MYNKIIFRLIEYSSFNTPLPAPSSPSPFISLPPPPPPPSSPSPSPSSPSSLTIALCVKTRETVKTNRQINIARLEFPRDGERQLGRERAEERQREGGSLIERELELALERDRAIEENDWELDKGRSGEGQREREPKRRDGLRELQKVRKGKREGGLELQREQYRRGPEGSLRKWALKRKRRQPGERGRGLELERVRSK